LHDDKLSRWYSILNGGAIERRGGAILILLAAAPKLED
jgi:hypothetical protein